MMPEFRKQTARTPPTELSRQARGPVDSAKLPANHAGRIPVLEYHVIEGTKNTLYTRTAESFKADLEDVYKRGYRPINISQLLDKDFSDVPAGMSPVVFVFDDASPSQFRYIQGADGKLTIDPTSGVGMWLDFAKTHPGWKNRGTFCMLNGASAGHNFFGDSPKFEGQMKAWRFQKVKWLADNGFELCDHTVWHARLDKFNDSVVQQQIGANAHGDRLGGARLQGAHDGAAVRDLAEESAARVGRHVDRSQDEAERTTTSSRRCSRSRAVRRRVRTIPRSTRTRSRACRRSATTSTRRSTSSTPRNRVS